MFDPEYHEIRKLQSRRPPGVLAGNGGAFGAEASEAKPSCLYSNNSIKHRLTDEDRALLAGKTAEHEQEKLLAVLACTSLLSPYWKRSAFTLYANVSRLISRAPSIGHVGFLTLTHRENITDSRETYRRFRSFNSNFLAPSENYGDWVCVKEPQTKRGKKNGDAGAWHYHILALLKDDIRKDFDYDVYENFLDHRKPGQRVPTGNTYLRSLWHELYQSVEKYGFGPIFSLEPIRSNEEAMARYMGKYISKGLSQRHEDHKGVRLVSYSRGWSRNSMRFAWHSENASEWRRKLNLFAQSVGCTEFYQLTDKLGSGWAYRYAQDIMNIENTLDEKGGVLEPDHQDRVVTRALDRRKEFEASKQRAKDDERFRSWERERTYQRARKKAKEEARRVVHLAIEEKRLEIEDMRRFRLKYKDYPPAPF